MDGATQDDWQVQSGNNVAYLNSMFIVHYMVLSVT
jgi:hypothetical protein